MANFTAGTSFSDGVTNDVTALKLNALVADAVPTSNLALTSTNGTIANFTSSTANITLGTIPTLTAGTTTGTAGVFTSGTLTTALIPTLTSGTTTGTAGIFTSGTITTALIPTGTFGTTTSTAATITTGTIPTLTTGTTTSTNEVVTNGTITNLSATTSTFLGTITGSTNVVNIGSGQIYKDSSGKVLIGTTSNDTGGRLEVKQGSSETGIGIQSSGTDNSKLYFRTASGTYGGDILFNGSYLKVSSGTTEQMRIDSSGNLLVGKTAPSTSTVGFQFSPSDNKIACGAASGASAFFNRNTDDGIIVQIAQDGTVEGSISVSGTTVSYNGGHLSRFSQLPSGQRDPAIKKGTVLSNLDAMCEWRDADGNLLPNEQLNKVKISDVEGDLNTAGVFVNWDNDDQDNPFDLNMAMTGDMIIRVAQGTSVNRGDLLMSAGDGTAKPQGDDIIRSKTIAKVTSTNVTCTYEDGSYCVPCVLMAC